VYEPESEPDLRDWLSESQSTIARGNGRAYGDAALNPDCTILTRRFNRFIAFDEESGLLTCEAGILLSEILKIFVPRGWFVPVTPGTKHVTVGGMVAADVHGKNHVSAGSFARHVAWIDLMIADGTIVRCAPDQNSDLFEATPGGMGLTGIIVRVAFTLVRIETDILTQHSRTTSDLAEAIEILEASSAAYSVAWVDCLARGQSMGRSVVLLADHARHTDLPEGKLTSIRRRSHTIRIPFGLPGFALNRLTVSAFNSRYYANASQGRKLVPIDRFFYPLDRVEGWNRLYGRRGFVQYQFALPASTSREGMSDILKRIAKYETAPFLAVLKRFGEGRGMLSFPIAGYTLALDFPATGRTFDLLRALDAVVAHHGGRIYLAKDVRSDRNDILEGYPGLAAFSAVRASVDPRSKMSSLLSRRLGL
jgi:FAD/FMN-containing dehydrogenase